MTTGSILQVYTTNIRIYLPNYRASNYETKNDGIFIKNTEKNKE